ncbi:MAG: hypothetical protein R3B95_04615 [Nitrospirales bacterium]|nr:hypothetical protein [Nitrospirales bacterium]
METYSIQESGVGESNPTEVTTRPDTGDNQQSVENVQMLDLWYQPSETFWALAGLDRQQAEKAFWNGAGMGYEDREYDSSRPNTSSENSTHPRLQRSHDFDVADRDALNTDLRVIRTSGDSLPPSYRIPQIRREFIVLLPKTWLSQ